MTYEELLIQADAEGLIVREKEIPGYHGRIYKNRIAIHKDIPTITEKSCVLAEEIGHYYTTSGDIMDQENAMNRKQEYKARFCGYNIKIGLMGIINAFKDGRRNLHEMAEHLDVSEQYLLEAINCYKQKYGVYTVVDNYIIYFEPYLRIGRIGEIDE